MLFETVVLLILCCPLLFLWRRFNSSLRHLRGPPNHSLLRGNLGQLYARDGWKFHEAIAERFGGAVKLHGLLGTHQLYLSDPAALYNVLVKDSNVYEEANWYLEGNMLVFGPGLLSTYGDHHKRQRKLLNPVFSTQHMRDLAPVFHCITRKLTDAIEYHLGSGSQEIDLYDWMSRTTLEMIAQAGLGYSIDSLEPESDSPTTYGKLIKHLIPSAFKLSTFRLFLPFLVKLGPPAFRRFLLDISPSRDLHQLKETVDVMHQTSTDIFQRKKMSFDEGDEHTLRQVDEGRDIMSILLKANLSASDLDRLPDSELLAQMSTFMFAGHDTTSSALSRTLHNLALHPEVQAQLRHEIAQSQLFKGCFSYEELNALPYLDAVYRETLRLNPPVNFMARIARRDMILPLGEPAIATDGVTKIHALHITKGTSIITAFGAVNRSKTIWGDDAYEWKPERWLSNTLPVKRVPGVYSSLLTFSAGPRACIGFKFAELEMKCILSMLVSAYTFELPDKKEIIWNLGGIQTPSIKDAALQTPTLPLKVSKLA
ncbi:cytochrome P450 [Rickenella mellea]|uniref:Cytochrome P450 n=1 Tax=Rickenella mellea TaxID=50990 RepID=A0A4Y7PZ11_9AGAM|nr:cytochrome P450 [Rickenella mellea]